MATQTESRVDDFIQAMIIVEDHCIQLLNLVDDFWYVWSGLSTKSQTIDLLIQNHRYGLFNTTLKEDAIVYDVKLSNGTHALTFPVAPDRLQEACIRLVMLTKNYPSVDTYAIPRHKSVADEVKTDLEGKLFIIQHLLAEIKKTLNKYRGLYLKFTTT